MASARVANDATGQMVLCIGTESVTVYTDNTGQPTQAPHFCPDCTLISLTAVLPDLFDVPIVATISPFLSMAYIAAQSHVIAHAYLSRAPPVLI